MRKEDRSQRGNTFGVSVGHHTIVRVYSIKGITRVCGIIVIVDVLHMLDFRRGATKQKHKTHRN
jgi:hypothetical protein